MWHTQQIQNQVDKKRDKIITNCAIFVEGDLQGANIKNNVWGLL